MKNNKLLFLFLFLNTFTFSQKKNIITYEAFSKPVNVSEIVKEKVKDEQTIAKLNQIFNSENIIQCILVIENGKSNFFKKNKINLDKNSIVDILVGEGLFYSDISKSYILEEKTTFDKLFLIKHEKLSWQLINEEKQIGKYLCKKAIAKKIIENNAGEFNTEVIAWYAPSIPLNFGPKNFSGLPGLIVELIDRQMVYRVATIELNTSSKKYMIKEPSKIETVSFKEYEKELKNVFNKMRN